MEGETPEIEPQVHQELTDVESLAGTVVSLGDSSATQRPGFSTSSCTEFELDDEYVEKFFDSQFPTRGVIAVSGGGVTHEKDVENWLNTNEDETQDVIVLVSEPDRDYVTRFDEEEIEKTGAKLVDVIKTEAFQASAWNEGEQEVPSGDFKTNFIKEVTERPVIALQNSVKTCCNAADNESGHLYIKILQSATRTLTQTNETADCSDASSQKSVDLNTLKNFLNGQYYSELRLKFTKLPKAKRPLVRAVEKFVSKEIEKAKDTNNAVIFTRFASIPLVVERCNEEKGLNFIPDKLAKYGIVLQRAVNQEIVARCVDFLQYVGFKLIAGEANELEISQFSSSFSQGSQGSLPDESESCCSQNSMRSEAHGDLPRLSSQNNNPANDFYDNAQNSPGGPELRIEVLRDQLDGNDSPQSSQISWTSFDSRSPPQPSIPEQAPEGMSQQFTDEDDVADAPGYYPEESVVDLRSLLPNGYASEGSQSSLESGEPERRRPRLELEEQ